MENRHEKVALQTVSKITGRQINDCDGFKPQDSLLDRAPLDIEISTVHIRARSLRVSFFLLNLRKI